MSISVDMLAAFVKVAHTRSVSRAAVELGVGKSVVSKRIAHLETVVKATLFSRSTRKVALTPTGESYLVSAQRVIDELQAAEERLRELRADLTGQIRLTAPVSWGQRVLAKRLPEFLRLHPSVDIELLLSDRFMDIADERIDVALRWTSTLPAKLLSAVVDHVAWVIVAAPDYLAAAGAPTTPQDLESHACMCYWREQSDDAWTLLQHDVHQPAREGAREGAREVVPEAARQAVRVKSRFHADNPEAVAEATLAGLGVALLPRYVCDAALADGRLVRVLDGWTPLTKFGTQIVAVATPERMRIARNRALLKYLQSIPLTAATAKPFATWL